MSSVYFDRIFARNVRGRNTAELEEYIHNFYVYYFFYFFFDTRNCIHAHLNNSIQNYINYFKVEVF